jgi:glutathione S-transferase
MKLHDLKAGLNPRRVRIFLAEKGLDLPRVEIDLQRGDNRTPEFLKLNPLGKLPVLELDDGSVLTESVAICHYIESLHPEPNLCGRDSRERAEIEMWDRRMEFDAATHAIGAFVHLHPFWIGRETQVAAFGELARDKLLQRMAWLDNELAEREFLAAGRYTLADITLQCTLVMAKGIGIRIPEQHAHLSRWFATVTARPSARA